MHDEEAGLSPLLSDSSKAIAIEILVHGAESRARLSHRLGLSPATLTRLVRPLIDAGVLVESDAVRTPGRGRASLPLDVVPRRFRFIGIKLTEKRIYAVVTDVRSRVLDQLDVPLQSLRVTDVVSAVKDIVRNLQGQNEQPVDAVGVTVGGRVDGGEVVADSPFLHWRDIPLRSLLSDALGVPVHLDNDVVGLTKAQQWFGHGKGFSSFALLTIGAGVGYGLVINDVMVPTHVIPVSHLPIDTSGPLCPLGHRGCATAYMTSRSISTTVSVAHGRLIEFDEVIEMAKSGDPSATQVVHEAARAVGRAVAYITALTGVERIILTGEGVHLVDVARSSVEDGRSEYNGDRASHSELIIRPMDFLEWARGAAVIAIQKEFPGSLPAAPVGAGGEATQAARESDGIR